MFSTFAKLPHLLAKVKPWVGVATVLTVALLGYYGYLGMQYLGASDEVAVLETQVAQQKAVLRASTLNAANAEAGQETDEERLETLKTFFRYPNTDDLVGILSATAQDASVNLQRVIVGDEQIDDAGIVRYATVPMTAVIEGDLSSIYDFIFLLHRAVPVVQFSSVSLTGLQGTPTAQVQLTFFLAPETPEEA